MSNIPKTIHYCWFGRGEKPKLAKKCIKSWGKYLPEYKIIEWNEKNFDINSNQYVKEAYEAKKYAFVSDYVRLYALYNYGGIYMDTDVEVLKPLDKFLINNAFSGFESEKEIPTGIMGCEKDNDLFKEFLNYYNNRSFIKSNGELDQTTNVEIITSICSNYGLQKNNSYQVVKNFTLYSKEYFCPLNYNNKDSIFTENTHTIHHFAGSWISEEDKRKAEKYRKYLERKDFLCKFMSEKYAYIILDFKWIVKNKIKKLIV